MVLYNLWVPAEQNNNLSQYVIKIIKYKRIVTVIKFWSSASFCKNNGKILKTLVSIWVATSDNSKDVK